MRSGITFWQLPSDEQELLAFLNTTGNVVGLPACWTRTKEEWDPVPITELIESRDPVQLVVALAEHIAGIEIDEYPEQNGLRFSIGSMVPCVITYSRGRLLRGQLAQSYLGAYLDYPNVDASTMIRKDERFTKWVKKILRWVKKRTPERLLIRGFPYRATTRVKEAVDRGEIEVCLY